MPDSTSALIARRKAAMEARSKPAPVVEDAEIPIKKPAVTPLRPPVIADEDDSDDEVLVATTIAAPGESLGTAVMGARPQALSLPMHDDPTRTIEANDQIMAKLKLSQAMSKVNTEDIVRQGNWYHSTLSENLGKAVRIIPVDMTKSRSYFVQGQGVMCRSFDMRQGEGDPGLPCEGTDEERATVPESQRGCPLRLWGDRDPETKKSSPPKCGINYNYPVLILDSDDPENGPAKRALLTLRSMGAKVAKAINSIVADADVRWHDVVLELGVEQMTNARGTFYVPTVKFIGYAKTQVSPEIQERARRFAASVNSAAIRATIESTSPDEDE